MAGKGGGSWKVAYADFVTAMMAFFLVMWIGAQDVKVKQAVANYFVDPSGASKKPVRNGAVFDKLTGGAVPDAEKTATGRGRNSYSSPTEGSWSTKLVGEFIHGDERTNKHWREQANRAREAAADTPEVRSRQKTMEEIAAKLLSKQLREEFVKSIPTNASGVYQDLLYVGMAEVNWVELAEDLVRWPKE
jgi:flagellar motor protein MotB